MKELADVDDVRPFLMASVKDNVVDIQKAMTLLKAYKDQIAKNQMKCNKLGQSNSNSGLVNSGVVTSSTTTDNNQSETTTTVTNSTN